MGMIQGIEPCTIHRLLRYAPRRASDGSLAPTDSASEEATLGEGGSFEHNRCGPGKDCVAGLAAPWLGLVGLAATWAGPQLGMWARLVGLACGLLACGLGLWAWHVGLALEQC